jgi:hypothetical protein
MAKKDDAHDLPADQVISSPLPVTAVAVAPVPGGAVFRDKVFTSRTLVLESGRTVPVARGRVTATDTELLTWLTANPEFERQVE